MPAPRQHELERLSRAARTVGLAVLVGIACWACVELTRESGRIASIWIANGLLAGVILTSAPRRTPALLLAGYCGNLVAALAQGDTLAVAISLCLCNTLEVALATLPLRRLPSVTADLTRRGALLRFGLLGVVLAPAAGGALASLIVVQTSAATFWEVFRVWYPADALGIAITTPLVIALRHSTPAERAACWRGGWLLASVRLLGAATLATFSQSRYPLLFLMFPPMLMITYWHRLPGAVLGTALVTAIAIASTVAGRGPLSLITGAGLQERVLVLQVFVGVLCITVLPMAALLAQRDGLDARLARREGDLRAITDNLPALIARIDADERYRFVNAHIGRIFGVVPAEMIGRTMREVRGEAIYRDIEPHVRQVLQGQSVSFEGCNEAGGRQYHYQSNYIPDIGAGGEVRGFYAMTFDITARKEAEQRLDQLTRRDTLTGLYNRREFGERLPQAAARAAHGGLGLAVLFIDVDHFKAINDQSGHAAGDEVLKEVAQRLQSGVRAQDTVARLAGDEFVVILESLETIEEPQFIARKIVSALDRPVVFREQLLRIGASDRHRLHARRRTGRGCAARQRRRRALRSQGRRPADPAPGRGATGTGASGGRGAGSGAGHGLGRSAARRPFIPISARPASYGAGGSRPLPTTIKSRCPHMDVSHHRRARPWRLLAAALLSGVAGAAPGFQLSVENDGAVSSRDRHYTQGARLASEPHRLFDRTRGQPASLWLQWMLGQQLYTPDRPEDAVPDPADRPYAGWLYGGAALFHVGERHYERAELLLGLVGPGAGGEFVQNGFHRVFGYPRAEGWDAQLRNTPTVTLTLDRGDRIGLAQWRGQRLELVGQGGLTMGNLFADLHAGLLLRAGNLRALGYGPDQLRGSYSGLPRLAGESEQAGRVAVWIGAQGRNVWRNLLLEGTDGDSPAVPHRPLVYDVMAGGAVSFGRGWLLELNALERSEEFRGQRGSDRLFGLAIHTAF